MLCYVAVYYAMLCYVMLRYITLRYVMTGESTGDRWIPLTESWLFIQKLVQNYNKEKLEASLYMFYVGGSVFMYWHHHEMIHFDHSCVVLCCVVWCAVLCCAVLCCAMLCYAMLCYAMLCYAMLCYAMLCYAMLCYAMLCLRDLSWSVGSYGNNNLVICCPDVRQNTFDISISCDIAYLPGFWRHTSLLNDGSCNFTHPVVKGPRNVVGHVMQEVNAAGKSDLWLSNL